MTLAALALLVRACGGKTGQNGRNAAAAGTGGSTSGGSATGGVATGGATSSGDDAPTGGASPAGAAGSGGDAPTGGTSPAGAAGAAGSGAITEGQLDDCVLGDECIIVPYDHCCGATRRAINAVQLSAYEAHPEWQVFNDPDICAVIGLCPDDSGVVDAWCSTDESGLGTCTMIWPDQCPVLDCDLDCPFGYWRDSAGCEACACAPPPLTLEPLAPFGLDAVTLTTVLDIYIGAIDRTYFDFTWQLDDPATDDEEHTVTVQVSLAHTLAPYFGTETTYVFLQQPSQIETVTATWQHVTGSPVDYAVVAGYLSVRLVDGYLEGGIYLEAVSDIGVPGSIVVGGSFREPDPWEL